MHYSQYSEYRKSLENEELDLVEVVDQFLQRISDLKHLNVFLEVYEQEAREKAALVSEKIKQGQAGKLAGMVIGLKDLFAYNGHGLQCGSKILTGFKSQFTATCVQKLLDEDAIIIGRQNCDEFGMGSANENSAFGPTLNFQDNNRVPGGSSGASAVAVQARLCHASIGSDTGGSVRQPSAFCGVVGLKPTYSRISRWGLAAYASSFDCVGPIANSVYDVAHLLEVMSGSDQYDSTVSDREVDAYTAFENNKYKIGYLKDALDSPGLDPEIKAATYGKLQELESQGHQIYPIEFPKLKYLLPIYYTLTMAEASSNLARYDGVRYGYRASSYSDLNDFYKKNRSEGFGKEVKRRIMMGTYILSATYYDAYYVKAQKVRAAIIKETEEFFEKLDFIITPTTPTVAFERNRNVKNATENYLADVFTVYANVVGIPAISIPNGKNSEGFPIGLQILGQAFAEKDLLSFAKSI